MKLQIDVHFDYRFARPTDVLLQFEAAHIPEQSVELGTLDLPPCDHFARVASHDGIGERIWLRVDSQLRVRYEARVAINRILTDCATLAKVQPHLLPGETVQYMLPSRYCPSDRFGDFIEATFGSVEGGSQVLAMRDWIQRHLRYVPGSSNSDTTAADTFITRQGVCRDYAHLLITFARAAGIPARIASVYALGVDPPDFHAVAEVFVGGEWHMIDATGMAMESAMVKIGIGRDAADVAFLTAFGEAQYLAQSVRVTEVL
ncbi:transglutaminase-like domain-containing protein [Novosphingobium sp. JCM 18896]|uniref:transglutaminase-like domain-containing protein n=1 Tax=Novosphingobium sp. JCM 18896 TaxID=2989731 RepID=UPI0022238337|nr:transglutaminase family protein [Novosphingobium sp. JCM 18896]MCW1430283.1 transglutaminase family protein [Novosphingobium sp. JCM 18896]